MKKISLLILGLLLFSSMPVKAYNLDGSYTNLDGDEVEFSTFQGKPLFVEAFSTTCDHCLDQHPEMVKLNDEYNGTLSMLSLTTNIDDDASKLLEYNSSYPTPWELGRNSDTTLEDLDVKFTPTMVLFDSDGNYANCWVGFTEFAVLDFEINAFIEDPTGYVSENGGGSCDNPNVLGNYILYGLIFAGLLIIYFYFTQRRRK